MTPANSASKTQARIPVPRYRPHGGAAVLSQGFRPLFLAAGLWAILSQVLFFAMLPGGIRLPTLLAPVVWHGHEMLFGYVAAVVVGFLLTAIPNWTGRMPLQGRSLLVLIGLWAAGRLAMLTSAWLGVWPAAAIELLFLATVLAAMAREILAGRNWRNAPMLAGLTLLLLADLAFHLQVAGVLDIGAFPERLAIATAIALIAMVGGRLIPSFTRNWLAKRRSRRRPASVGVFDRSVLGLTAVALAAWSLDPDGTLARAALGLAALANLLRLARWRGQLTIAEPLLWALHLGYLWLAVGLGLLALGDGLPADGALHALTVGAIGTMTLAVMSRTSLAQTGRPQRAGRALTAALALITAAGLLRVAAPLVPEFYAAALGAAAVAWIAAFALFLAYCGPLLVLPRLAKAR